MHNILNKRLLCFLLCMIMLLGVVLTSCGEKTKEEQKDEITEEGSETAGTLAMYLMSENAVSEATRQSIESAVNRITKAKHKTQIKLYIYPESEYYVKLEEAFAKRDEAKANGLLGTVTQNTVVEETTEETDETMDSIEITYPEIADYQVDIFYMGGQANYQKYLSANRLKDISSRLSTSATIRKSVHAPFFTALENTNAGKLYAVPTGQRIGEYTYLLVNKDALNAKYETIEGGKPFNAAEKGFTSLTSAGTKELLEFINDYYQDEFAPLYTDFDQTELMISNLKFWGVDSEGALADAFSVLGNYFDGSATLGQVGAYETKIQNLFENDQFLADLETLFTYRNDGYYRAEGDDKAFAVGYVRGQAEDAEKYKEEGYEVVVVEKPTLSVEDAYANLFGICDYTSDDERAMKILTEFNTNKELRNLILYGIEGTHYNLSTLTLEDESDSENDETAEKEVYEVVERLLIGTADEYKMSVHKTGNELIVYPEKGMALDANKFSSLQNTDAKVDLYAGFTGKTSGGYAMNTEDMQAIRALSAEILNDYLTATDYDAFVAAAKAKIDACDAIERQLSGYEKDKTSLQAAFFSWAKTSRFTTSLWPVATEN